MCPGRESTQKRCPQKIPRALLALLFRDLCCLCGTVYSASCPAIIVDCALEHSFCGPCLHHDIVSALSSGQHAKCPRAAECRYIYEEADVRLALGCDRSISSSSVGDDDEMMIGGKGVRDDPQQMLEDRVLDWFDIRSGKVQEKHPGTKHCPVPNCKGQRWNG